MKQKTQTVGFERRRGMVFACMRALPTAILLGWFAAGCGRSPDPLPPKAPRPVTVLTLSKQTPEGSYQVSGAVKSWKTQQIGFEVAGRVEWVLEPGEDVEPRIVSPEGTLIEQGRPMAAIDRARYEVALASAKARLRAAELERDAIEIRFQESLPAEIKSAEFDHALAVSELERIKKLLQQKAASQAEYDQAENLEKTRRSRVTALMASRKQAEAEANAAAAEVERANQDVADAQRDLDNTTLFAAFQGQISDVHVVPGSVVSPGSPVLTLVMMDPIKVEVELSADESRKFKRRRHVPVSYKLPDTEGTTQHQNAMVYNVDTSADPNTRTFSLTLLLLNEKYRQPPPDVESVASMARAADVWPLGVINRIIGADAELDLVEEDAILQDEQGHYVYQLANASMGETFPEILKVRRQDVTLEDIRIPFLGIWTFQAVRFKSQDELHDESLIIGELEFKGRSNSDWDGQSVILDSGAQWVLRPGDLVNVNLAGDSIEEAYYVPEHSIYEESGTTSLFVVDGDAVRRLRVDTVDSDTLAAGSMVQVRSPELCDGMQIVLEGAHYLEDGDAVQPVGPVDNQRSSEQ